MELQKEFELQAGDFGLDLTENINQELAGQLKRAEKLDEVDTITFGLETDDSKIVKVFVNAKDAEKFERIMADCLGSTESIEDAINKAAAEVDIIDVEWPEEDEEEPAVEDDGSSAMNPAVYSKDQKGEPTKAKKDMAESLTYGEQFSQALIEDQGSVAARMTTPNQQLVYQAILDLGIPEIALDRSPYRAALIKGLKDAAQELQGNGTTKAALKAFVKGSIDPVQVPAKPAIDTKKQVNEFVDMNSEVEPAHENKVIMSKAEDGMLLQLNGLVINLTTEELEQALKAIEERTVAVIGKHTLSPRGTSTIVLKPRTDPRRIILTGAELGEFKALARDILDLPA